MSLDDSMDEKPIKKIEGITEEEYINVQDGIVGRMAERTQRYANLFSDTREVVELISGLGGTVAFYKKECDDTIVYDYAISLPLGWDYEDFFGE